MSRLLVRFVPVGIPSFMLALSVLPARESAAQEYVVPAVTATVPVTSPYVVYRPQYNEMVATRPLFISNYAGYNYPARNPNAALTPTGFGRRRGRLFHFGHHDNGW